MKLEAIFQEHDKNNTSKYLKCFKFLDIINLIQFKYILTEMYELNINDVNTLIEILD